MGIFNPFGSTISWPATSEDGSASNPQRDIIRDLALKTPTLALAGAMNLGETMEGLSIGASVDVVMGSVFFGRDLVFGSEAATLELSGKDVGVGGRFGMQYASPDVEGATFGVTFRLPVDLQFEGNMDIDFEGDETAPDYRSALPPDGEISGQLTLPLGVEFCIGSQWSENLHVGAAATFNQWSSYEELGFTLPDGSYSASPKNWHDAYTLRFGAEYNMDDILLRAGYMNDQTPMPDSTLDASLTDMTRHYVTAGAGMTMGDMDLHFSVLYKLPTGSRSASTLNSYSPPHKGEYTLDIFMASLAVSYRAGADEEAAE
jgi:long-subunit fatty acid transport protein